MIRTPTAAPVAVDGASAVLRSPCKPLDLLALHRAAPERYPFLLESSAGAIAQGRYDLLLALPGESLCLEAGRLTGASARADHDFLTALDDWTCRLPEAPDGPADLPFIGGWFIYLGYELAGQVEPALSLPPADDGLPTALAVRCPAAVIRDRQTRRCELVAETPEQLRQLEQDCAALDAGLPAIEPRRPVVTGWREDPPARYIDSVHAIREYILAGDVFQVNLCREWQAELAEPCEPAIIYSALRSANPAPFSGLMCWQGRSVISSSPERLMRLDGHGRVSTRPIAGTRPRTGRDTVMTRELLTHPKERAEHVMLIDLERNDLGRVCEYGSVRVDELMTVESYAHVHHIVSNVSGRLRAGTGPGAALRAGFPGGTITGCPKVRCMQIIAELEGSGRGAYTGSMGYVSRDGRMDSNILIRSLVQNGRGLSLRAGAGIVADSDPQAELDETRAKARGVLLALDGTGAA